MNLSRPDGVFLVVWAGTSLLAYADLYHMGFDPSARITALIVANILSGFVAYALASRVSASSGRDQHAPLSERQIALLQRIHLSLFAIWCGLFAYITYRSRGLPIGWRLAHADKSYVDYGVPTLSGFANMLRTFLLCLSVLLFARSRTRSAMIIAAVLLLCSAFEMARGNTTCLLLSGLAVFLVRRRITARSLAIMTVIAVAFVIGFGVAEQYRSPHGSGNEVIMRRPSILNRLPYGVTSVYLYLSTPVSNLYSADTRGIVPLGHPYYSLQLVVPTILRDTLYPPRDYPITLREAKYNATTFYAPFIADFGIPAAGLIVFLIQVIVSYVYIKAARGDVFSQLIYGPLFASLVLSFFFNYFLTLGVLLFPVLAWFVRTLVMGGREPGVSRQSERHDC
jgi:oligosaccharide repeat unit polymerase